MILLFNRHRLLYRYKIKAMISTSRRTLSHYYKIFNLSPGYTEQQLKNAYLEMVKKYHPDLNKQQNALQKFQEIQEAYDILTDPEKTKKLFDNTYQDKKPKQRNQQDSDDYDIGGFQKKFADRYAKINKTNEGMQFSYNLYKKHYEQVQERKKQYQRFHGHDKEYYVEKKQMDSTQGIIKKLGAGALIIGIAASSVWFVNHK